MNLVEKNGFRQCSACFTVRPLKCLTDRKVTVKIELDGKAVEKVTEQKICNDGFCVHLEEMRYDFSEVDPDAL